MDATANNPRPDCDGSDFSESNDEDGTEKQDHADDVTEKSSNARQSLRVTVHREEIESTTVREGNEELEGLDVDVYDQSAYEKGIFDQVDKAITSTSDAGERREDSSNISDLIRLIHNQDPQNVEEGDESAARDEQVLELTRAQRVNKKVKLESSSFDEEPTRNLPRIPRIPKITRPAEQKETDQDLSEDNGASQVEVIWTPQFGQAENNLRSRQRACDTVDEGSDGSTSVNEYHPEGSSGDEDDINVEYDSDDTSNSTTGNDDSVVHERKHKGIRDDGDYKCYASRIKAYARERAKARLNNISDDGVELRDIDKFHSIDGDLQIPEDMWNGLFEHQRTGVRWLWELHQLGTGGILGDEMGLGKTIEMIAFLTALKCSNVTSVHKGFKGLGPTVLVCPATVMHQWLLEFRKWYPPFRVAILHSTGSFSGEKKHLVQVIHKSTGILICSYPGVIIYQDILHDYNWHYAILDEGHKIRNPDAQVTLACKRFKTPHRIILSGSPVQNNLRELWSIFDFIYPGKLGTLPVFMSQFAIPITQGGYANSTDIQVQIAYKCACILRDTIKPFLLRRTKAEVNSKLKLPDRNEQVLFCKLTDRQRMLYQAFLDSPTVRDIKRGLCQIFVGLIQLRKICNHPDLFDATECRNRKSQTDRLQRHDELILDENYGHFQKSGKMMVVDALLKLWKKQGHKVLLFTQSRQMVKIFSKYLTENGYSFLTMDGTTQINVRHTLIDKFNNDQDTFLFLLTTRVGGVGVNLIGANRIIIFDPDWNPSTDIQARERAWRIGQQRHVIIYRLLTAGTIEEKIYHRQVFKLYLTNRILQDAKQKRFFKTNDLHELFTLGENEKNIETNALFDENLSIDRDKANRNRKLAKRKKARSKSCSNANGNIQLSEEKLAEMRERAKKLSQMIALKYGTSDSQAPDNEVTKKEADSQQVMISADARIKTENSHNDLCNTITARPTTSKAKDKDQLDSIRYLVKQKTYKTGTTTNDHDSQKQEDDYILKRLFKNSNVCSALKHDKIESDSGADFKIVEKEAEKVARDAIRALKESRRMCLDSRSGIPNWTGSNGYVADKPRLVPKNKGRLNQLPTNRASSSKSSDGSLLDSIRQRNQSNPLAVARDTFGALGDSDEEERDRDYEGRARDTGADEMADKIREFVMFKSANGGEAQTDEMLDFFKSNYPPDKTAIFKALLYKICEFQRRGTKGFWTIRSEFRN